MNKYMIALHEMKNIITDTYHDLRHRKDIFLQDEIEAHMYITSLWKNRLDELFNAQHQDWFKPRTAWNCLKNESIAMQKVFWTNGEDQLLEYELDFYHRLLDVEMGIL